MYAYAASAAFIAFDNERSTAAKPEWCTPPYTDSTKRVVTRVIAALPDWPNALKMRAMFFMGTVSPSMKDLKQGQRDLLRCIELAPQGSPIVEEYKDVLSANEATMKRLAEQEEVAAKAAAAKFAADSEAADAMAALLLAEEEQGAPSVPRPDWQ